MKQLQKNVSILCALALFFGLLPGLAVSAKAADYQVGDVLEFGAYPQTRVEDEALIAALEAESADAEWQSLGYNVTGLEEDFAFYKDIAYGGERYRAALFTMYRSIYGGGGIERRDGWNTGYDINTVYWFKIEPISWTVLDPESGLLLANVILDAQAINDYCYNTYYADPEHQYYLNNYAVGQIRPWLSDTFLHTAFTDAQIDVIETKLQSNDMSGTAYEEFQFEDTSDPVFLLSMQEARAMSVSRIRYGTDYAKMQNLSNYDVGNGADLWFLRSPGSSGKSQSYISYSGRLYAEVNSNSTDVGICPAVYIDLDAYEQLNAASDPTPTPYDGLSFDYADGILTVSGEGMIPTADAVEETPLAPFAGDCRVVILTGDVEGVQQNAFKDFSQLHTLILDGDMSLASGAFASNDALETVICAGTVQFAEGVFPESCNISVYEPKDAPHTGTLPSNCTLHPYSFSEGTLYIEGDVEMDMYALLDLMTVMCGYYENIQFVRFDAYTSLDVPFYVYDKSEETYVIAENDTLNGVRFSVKLPGDEGWESITFNEFCSLAAAQEIGNFRLAADLETGEEVQESTFKIMLNTVQHALKAALKWIVGLLNYLFDILSKFKK